MGVKPLANPYKYETCVTSFHKDPPRLSTLKSLIWFLHRRRKSSLFIIMVRKRTKKTRSSRGCKEHVDRISALSDDLLVKILTCLPTRVAASTTVLSKRWECLWMGLPKLWYYCRGSVSETESLGRFLDLNMPLHRAPVIESFHLRLVASSLRPQNIQLWLVTPLSRHLRELEVTYHYSGKPNILPSSLYTCKSLVILRLGGDIRLGCLPSLKTLELILDKYLEGESLRRLLSICPVLENLLVDCGWGTYDKGPITVAVPSLQSLTLYLRNETEGVLDGLVIDTPSLKYLKLRDLRETSRPTFSIEAVPNLEEAYVDFRNCNSSRHIKRLMGSITSVKRLTICSEFLYGDGLVFNQLEHLKLCVCTYVSSNLLARLLEDSPNLRVLDILLMDHYDIHWNQSRTSVDESVMSSLQAFNWSRYFQRRPQAMDLAVYILGEKWSLNDCNNLV